MSEPSCRGLQHCVRSEDNFSFLLPLCFKDQTCAVRLIQQELLPNEPSHWPCGFSSCLSTFVIKSFKHEDSRISTSMHKCMCVLDNELFAMFVLAPLCVRDILHMCLPLYEVVVFMFVCFCCNI